MKKNNKTTHNERGQALIIITFAIIGLIGMVGLAVDGGLAYSDHRHAQNTADSAAYAAALAYVNGTEDETLLLLPVYDIAGENGYGNMIPNTKNKVEFDLASADIAGCPTGSVSSHKFTVTIESHINTTFATVIGIREMTSKAISSTRVCEGQQTTGGPLYNNNSVTSLNTDDCGGTKSKNLYVGGSGQLQLYGGGMGSASKYDGCIDFKGGETQIKKEDPYCGDLIIAAPKPDSKDVKSLAFPDKCNKIVPNASSASFPEPPNLNITCSTDAKQTGSKLSPGNWDTSKISPGGISTLQPGTYCITGGIHLTGGSLNGTGVTLVMLDGSLKLTGGTKMGITAPSSDYDSFGNYTKGLLVYYPKNNSNVLEMMGGSNAKLSGTILAQSANCYFAGSEQIQKAKLQFICKTWQSNGSSQAELVWDPSSFFAPPTSVDPSIQLFQ